MNDEKDRLGSKLEQKQRGDEDRYFQEQDRQRIERLRKQQEEAKRADKLGLCPRCATPLVQQKVEDIEVDRCPEDCGMWLDKGEMESIESRLSNSWLFRIFHPRKS